MSSAAFSFVSRHLAGWLLLLGLCQTTAWAAEPPNTMGQRMQACASCHGKEGRASNSGYLPRIAGKPAGYLYNQLINFRDGRRQNATMAYLLDHMSDPYLMEIANHFASLDLPYPPAQTTQAPAATLARGEQLVRHGDATRGVPACASCHGAAMTGVAPAMPGLLGLPHEKTNWVYFREADWFGIVGMILGHRCTSSKSSSNRIACALCLCPLGNKKISQVIEISVCHIGI